MKHTKEPWYTIDTCAGSVWVYAKGEPILEPEAMPSTLRKIGRSVRGFFQVRGTRDCYREDSDWWAEVEANAERIVACVNACEGINPEAVPVLLEALQEIAKGKGEFSTDPEVHAWNTIFSMKWLANTAIAKARS